ncbi:MAG: IS256 family transposase [Actinomycetota bacterium]|nr:IS256 family transposase [Actinomycetota bacterium]
MKDLADLTLTDLWKEVKDEENIWGDLKLEAQQVLKKLIRGVLEVEMVNYLQAEKHERTENRISYRNGCYFRDLETSLGLITELEVPRSRDGGFEPTVFEYYKRRQREVEQTIKDMFLAGVSTRRVGEVIRPLLGFEVSATTVSSICKSLDREVKKYHERLIEDKYLYLFLDGITLKARNVLEVKKRIVLCAHGITCKGKRELISFRQARSESEEAWQAFLNDLYSRGLKGKHLSLIIVDGCPGLLKALDIVYPYIPIQRCWVHKLRNVANKLPQRKQEEVLKGAKAIYKAENKKEAVRLYWEWAKAYRKSYPEAVECLEKDIDGLLSFMDFPRKHWIKIRTTNIIERSFREVRRRTRPMSSFSNYRSVDRIIYGIIHYLNSKWEKKPLKEFTQLS